MRLIRVAIASLGVIALSFATETSDYPKALALYSKAQYQSAVQLLIAGKDRDARTNALLGRSYLMMGAYHDATDALNKAVEQEPGNAAYYHWLGRAYGRRAETAFPVAAPGYATKARANFEKSMQLDPNDSENRNDLFEYYLQAPSLLGGGLDKASKLADDIARRDPAEGEFAKARIAEHRKDFAQAEAHLKKASELEPDQPGRLVDVAKVLAKQGRYEESDSFFAKAHQVAPNAARVYFAEAAAYIRANRKQDEARELLKKYLSMNTSPDDPSKSEARKLLSKVS